MLPEQTCRYGVESPAPDVSSGSPHLQSLTTIELLLANKKRINSSQHLGRRTASEGQQQNPTRINPPSNQAGHAMSQRRGLSCSRTSNDQEWVLPMQSRRPLLWIQTGKK